eukprot:CAMPEP_0174744488 /NCGR_PEP_ID=MMETSP1094-20130205/84497_1 /TAXON_ID=156173 /ORGANISM="Chrysochromulina brevifilum, Strain UTEX LB 985" /LENGTH=46 /DNA_ID= /DNA_START= /DNA_END= /DNA_ORIENTATION=
MTKGLPITTLLSGGESLSSESSELESEVLPKPRAAAGEALSPEGAV